MRVNLECTDKVCQLYNTCALRAKELCRQEITRKLKIAIGTLKEIKTVDMTLEAQKELIDKTLISIQGENA